MDKRRHCSPSVFGSLRQLPSVVSVKIVLVLLSCAVHGQQSFSPYSELKITQLMHNSWRVRDGNIPDVPNVIAQTTDGYLWIGTEAGLLRFDGVRFQALGKAQDKTSSGLSVKALLATSDGTLWVGTSHDLDRLRGGVLRTHAGHIGWVNNIIRDAGGNIWMARTRNETAGGGLCEATTDGVRCFGKNEGLDCTRGDALADDGSGGFWVGFSELCHWSRGKSEVFPFHMGAGDLGVLVMAMVPDGHGGVTIGFNGVPQGRASTRDASIADNQAQFLETEDSFRSDGEITALLRARDGTLWVGTEKHGLYHVSPLGVDHYGSTEGLSGDMVNSLIQDREGSIWVTTGEGLDCFHIPKVVTLSTREGLNSNTINSVIAEKDGSVLIATLDGLNRYADGRMTSIPIPHSFGHEFDALFEDHSGKLWVSTPYRVAVFAAGKLSTVLPARRPENVVSITQASDGSIWLGGGSDRLTRIDGHGKMSRIRLPVDKVAGMAADHADGIWVGRHNMLYKYRGNRIELAATIPSDLAIKYFEVAGDNSIWAPSAAGLLHWKDGVWTLLDSKRGLPCSSISEFQTDSSGNWWLDASCGLLRISSAEMLLWTQNPISSVHPTVLSGLDGARFSSGNFVPFATRSRDGKLWFSGDSGVEVVSPEHLAWNSLPPPVHIESLVVDGADHGVAEEQRIKALSRNIEIDYTALSFVIPRKVQFQYRLWGFDKDWQYAGIRRQAFYQNLPPGTYRFQVIASNNDGVWNEDGASLALSVAPAWFQTNWFRIACVGAVLTLMWGLYQLRFQQLRRQFRMQLEARVNERTRIAQDLHDTFFQGIQGLLLRFHTATSQLSKDEPARQIFEETLKQSDRVMLEGRELVLDLRATASEQNDLPTALADLGEGMRKSSSSEIKVVVNGAIRALHPVVFEELFKIGKEALGNAFRHSRAHNIETEINYESKQLRLRIRDDGEGIDPGILEQGHRRGHLGLPGMRERAKKIGAHIDVWSQSGAGTEVEVRIPSRLAYEPEGRTSPISWVRRLWPRDNSRERHVSS
jgi:signal transduction histidine kinase/ligand-binding sensor domain-containing protein